MQNDGNVEFWDKQIIAWESSRYKVRRYFDFFSSLKYRKFVVSELIKPYLNEFKILELGCGSNCALAGTDVSILKSYCGIDSSKNAVLQASFLYKNFPNIKFLRQDVGSLNEIPDADLVISLGLVDWLDDDRRKILANISKDRFFVHTFSQKKGFLRLIHVVYKNVLKLFGKKYDSRYDSREEIKLLFPFERVSFFTHRKLSFGCIAISLPDFLLQDFKVYLEYLDKNIIWKFIKNLEKMQLFNVINRLDYVNALDVGPGIGDYCDTILRNKNCKLTLVEKNFYMSNFLSQKKNHQTKVINADFTTLEFFEKFDCVFCIGVLEYQSDKLLFLKSINLRLSEKGYVFLLFPSGPGSIFYWLSVKLFRKESAHFLNQKRLSKLLSESGFKIQSKKFIFPFNMAYVCTRN